MKLRKVTIQVEILMEENHDHTNMDLTEIEHECIEGEWSYAYKDVANEIIEGEEACKEACDKQGTDLSFFFPDEEGEFINYYRCSDCDHKWSDKWKATCDDTCPKCGLGDIEPYKSEDA